MRDVNRCACKRKIARPRPDGLCCVCRNVLAVSKATGAKSNYAVRRKGSVAGDLDASLRAESIPALAARAALGLPLFEGGR